MSHAEIWDDSALVDSWNEALEEYKHYHSIHARGEKVEEVLKAFDEKENSSHENIARDYSGRQEEMVIPNGTKGDGNEEGVAEDAKRDHPAENKLSQADQALNPKPSEGGSQRISPPPLQHLIGSVHDEGLKSLLMSWYYAGYYTGLYEGQHHGR